MKNTFFIDDFRGGQVSDLNPLLLQPGQFVQFENVVCDSGMIVKRPGFSTWCDAITGKVVTGVKRMLDGILIYCTAPPTFQYLYAAEYGAGPQEITLPGSPQWNPAPNEGLLQTAVYEDATIVSRINYAAGANDDRMIILYKASGTVYAKLLGETAPTGISGAKTSGSALEIGTYKHVVTVYDPDVDIESAPSGRIETTTSSGMQEITLSSMPSKGGNYKNRIYRTSVDNEILQYVDEVASDGSSYIDDVPDLDLGTVFTNWDGEVPKAFGCIEIANNRLFMANYKTCPYRLMYSNVGEFGCVPPDNIFEMPDKQPIYGIHALGDKLVVLSKGLVRVLHIKGHPVEWELTDPLIMDGPITIQSTCRCDNFIAFMGKSGIWLYDGIRFANISQNKINDDLYKSTTVDTNWMVYDPIHRRLYVSVEEVADTTYRFWCYQFDTGTWSEVSTNHSTYGIYSQACVDKEGRVVIGSLQTATIWLDDTATNDNGTAITMTVKSGLMDFGSPETGKLVRALFLDLDWDGTGSNKTLQMKLYDETGNSASDTKTMAVDADTDRIRIPVAPFNARTLQWELSDQGQFDKFNVRGFGVQFVPRRLF